MSGFDERERSLTVEAELGTLLAAGHTRTDATRLLIERITKEARLATTVVLVEGLSDQIVLEVLAERQGRTLRAEGTFIVPAGGATNFARCLRTFARFGGYRARPSTGCGRWTTNFTASLELTQVASTGMPVRWHFHLTSPISRHPSPVCSDVFERQHKISRSRDRASTTDFSAARSDPKRRPRSSPDRCRSNGKGPRRRRLARSLRPRDS